MDDSPRAYRNEEEWKETFVPIFVGLLLPRIEDLENLDIAFQTVCMERGIELHSNHGLRDTYHMFRKCRDILRRNPEMGFAFPHLKCRVDDFGITHWIYWCKDLRRITPEEEILVDRGEGSTMQHCATRMANAAHSFAISAMSLPPRLREEYLFINSQTANILVNVQRLERLIAEHMEDAEVRNGG